MSLLALLLALGGIEPASRVETTLVGSAEVRLVGQDGRASARIVFAVAVDPAGLRLEVVRAGGVGAVVHADAERLDVLVPGPVPLLHETEPTRAGFESALGLPFCLEELIYTLRAGHAPPPRCEGEAEAEPVLGRRGRVLGLRRAEDRRGRPGRLRFSQFRQGASGEWPGRAVLESPGAVATVQFGSIRPHDRPPLPLDREMLARARLVDAAELRRALGLEGESSPAP